MDSSRQRLAPPERPAGAVLRPRVDHALAVRFDTPIVIVRGAAGAGKTSALADAVRANAAHPVGVDHWIALSKADRDPTHLLARLAAALGCGVHRVDAILDQLALQSPQDVCLLFEDIHVLEDSDAVPALAQLVDALPTNAHVVLSTRGTTAVPTAHHLAAGRAIMIDESVLRFDAAEMQTVAASAPEHRQHLEATDGWPALVGLAMRGFDPVLYLEDAVVPALDAETLRALAMVVAVGRCDRSLAADLFADRHALDEVAALPLVSTTAGGTVEPHALWQLPTEPVLRHAEARDVRRRAAMHHEGAGRHEAAMALLDPAFDWDLVAATMESAFATRHGDIGLMTYLDWQRAVPESQRETTPAKFLDAIVAKIGGPQERAGIDALLEIAADYHERGDEQSELAALFHANHLGWVLNDFSSAIDTAVRTQRLAEGGNQSAHWLLQFWEATTHVNRARYDDALAIFHRFPESIFPRFWMAIVWFMAHQAALQGGRFEDAVHFGERSSAGASAGFTIGRRAPHMARWFRGEQNAIADWTDELRWGAATANPRDRARNLSDLAMILAHEGAAEEARSVLAEARSAAGNQPLGPFALTADVAEALLLLADDEAAASAHLRSAVPVDTAGEAVRRGRLLPGLFLFVVLAPDRVRELGDVAGDHKVAIELAAAFVRARAQPGHGALATATWPSPGQLRSIVPASLRAEFAAAGLADDVPGARQFLDDIASDTTVDIRRQLLDLRDSTPRLSAAVTKIIRSVPVPPRDPVRLAGLGALRLDRGGQPVEDKDWRRGRVRTLLASLVLSGPMRRELLADRLWPELDGDAAANNLATTLAYLHKVLEPDRPAGAAPYLVRSTETHLELFRAAVFGCDAWDLVDAAEQARRAEQAGRLDAAADAYGHAADLATGDWLEEIDAPWVLPDRERLRAEATHAMVRSGELALAGNDVGAAFRRAAEAVGIDPWSERAYALLVATHLADGSRSGARTAMDRCHTMLDELGVAPSAGIQLLSARIEAG